MTNPHFTIATDRDNYLEVRDYDNAMLVVEARGFNMDDVVTSGETTLDATEVKDLHAWLGAWLDRTRCRYCHQVIAMHEPTGLWAAPRDVTTGTCDAAYRGGWNDAANARHAPEEDS